MMGRRASLRPCSCTLLTELFLLLRMAQPPLSSWPWPALQLLEQRTMPARCEAIAEVIAWLEEVGEREGWPLKSVFALTLCADEALTNIVTHAKPDVGGALHIQLLLGALDEEWVLCIADNGAEFDPTTRESAQLAENLDDAEMGGHGLRLMRHYLQHFEYRRSAGLNWLLLGVSIPDTAD